MEKKNVLGLAVLSSLLAIAGLSSFKFSSSAPSRVYAEDPASSMPSGWNKEGETSENKISSYEDAEQGHSILLKRSSANGSLKARTNLVNVKGNAYYNVSFAAKTVGSSSLRINVVEYKNNGATAIQAETVGSVSAASNAWVSRPGMFKTAADATQIVVEIEALGVGDVYVAKLTMHEGVEPNGSISSRTKVFEGDSANPESAIGNYVPITENMLSGNSSRGSNSLKLVPGRGVYLSFDDYKIVGKFTLRFKYRYINVAGGTTGTRLAVKLDGINKNGQRVWYGEEPKSGWTPYGLWDSYSYEFSAKPGVAEPSFVIIYAALQESGKTSNNYYLLDDVEVIDEKGNNIIESGGFELKENGQINTIGYFNFAGSTDADWAASPFTHIPASSYINSGYEGSRAVHLENEKALGFSLPVLPKGQYTFSFKYRVNTSSTIPVRIDNFSLDGVRAWYIYATVSNTNDAWVSCSYQFKTYHASEELSVPFMVFNAKCEIDIDDISIKNQEGAEFLYGGNFDPCLAGGVGYVNNASAYRDEKGGIVYSSIGKLSMGVARAESYLALNMAGLGLDKVPQGTKYNVSYEYLGGAAGSTAAMSDQNAWLLGDGAASSVWTKRETELTITQSGGYNNQQLRLYGNNYSENNAYIRNISIKDSDNNEYFHPFDDGLSILPQGAFFVNEDKEVVDQFVEAYFAAQMAEDYTTVPESERGNICRNKYNRANGALNRLSSSQKELFNTSPDYAAQRAALAMWKGTSKDNASISSLALSSSSDFSSALVTLALAISSIAVMTFAVSRKKKQR